MIRKSISGYEKRVFAWLVKMADVLGTIFDADSYV